MKRYTDEEKRRILEELAASGLSRAAFCRERGLCYASVGAWAKARVADSETPIGFVEVGYPTQPSSTGVEVWLSGSICVRFSPGTDSSELANFCQRMAGC